MKVYDFRQKLAIIACRCFAGRESHRKGKALCYLEIRIFNLFSMFFFSKRKRGFTASSR